jgi:nucleoid DNA-binding protein
VAARKRRNPATGAEFDVPAGLQVKFRISSALKAAV